jgi:hypothetical protein
MTSSSLTGEFASPVSATKPELKRGAADAMAPESERVLSLRVERVRMGMELSFLAGGIACREISAAPQRSRQGRAQRAREHGAAARRP